MKNMLKYQTYTNNALKTTFKNLENHHLYSINSEIILHHFYIVFHLLQNEINKGKNSWYLFDDFTN